METIIVSVVLSGAAVLITGFYLYNRSRERRAMIEKGLDPSLVNIYSGKWNYRIIFLFTGILLLGAALGISSGVILARVLKTPGETKELILLSLIIWTGISCILCYYLSRDHGDA